MDTQRSDYWISKLALQAHPEGGFYRETYRSAETFHPQALAPLVAGKRNFSTSIYFLLTVREFSSFHRIQSDELWHYHIGGTLWIHVLTNDGLEVKKLGANLEAGESPQVMIPARSWFAAEVKSGEFVLTSCTVAPGFDFADFELAKRQQLVLQFPEHRAIIERLTRA
jgi:predicted cupin superfamily sugar epimerase